MADVVYHWTIAVNGAPLAPPVHGQFVTGSVDVNVNLPDMAILEFSDIAQTVLTDGHLTIGAKLAVTVASDSNKAGVKLFDGEVTGVDCEYDGVGVRTVVRGYDVSHRLHRGRRTAAYVDVSYTDVVRKVAQRAGIPVGTVDASGAVQKHVSQANLDDWTFLRSLAAEIGFDLTVEAGKLCFRKPKLAAAASVASKVESINPLQFYVGDAALLRLRTALSAVDQVSVVKSMGWDSKQKKPVVATAPAPGTHDSAVFAGSSPASLAAKFGVATMATVSGGPRTQGDAQKAATAVAARVGGTFADVEAEVLGDPRLRPGVAVAIGGLGTMLSGKFTLSSARHVLDDVGGYRTTFTVSDRQDRTLYGLTGRGREQPPDLPGVVPAIVTDNNDTLEKGGRVKVTFPWLDPTYESGWARVVQPGAGKNRGFQVLPEVGDEVLVAFEHGDVNRPYVLGGLHNGIDIPKVAQAQVVTGGKVMRRAFTTRVGHQLLFVDEVGPAAQIVLALGDGKTTVTLGGGPTKGVTVDTDRDVAVTTKAKASVDAIGDVSVTSKANVSVQAQAQVNVKGAMVNIEATGPLELKGAIVKISASGPLEATGAIIKLN